MALGRVVEISGTADVQGTLQPELADRSTRPPRPIHCPPEPSWPGPSCVNTLNRLSQELQLILNTESKEARCLSRFPADR